MPTPNGRGRNSEALPPAPPTAPPRGRAAGAGGGAGGGGGTGGGKVVKTVAGYDLPKLYIGSFGTLGVIVEATVKLRPRPDADRLVVARFASLKEAGVAARAVMG